ncbi:fimbrial biogenesis chaperone [Methylibium sp.]|uniref:fimbrial biogenesis chaperone n=1 Tax=Methylibium sp. TaxID=2067992 RepID=UPI003D0CDD4E
MKQSARRWMAALLLPLLAAACGDARAASLHVAPLRVVLTSDHRVASLTLGNSDNTEVAVQVEVLAWSQRNGEDVYEPTRDVLVNPSIFRVPGRGQQIVRLGLQVPPTDTERSYRVFLQQLPGDQALPQDAGGGARLQTLLRIGLPVFVPAITARQDLQWRLVSIAPAAPDGATHLLSIDNRGTQHLQLTRLVLRREEGDEQLRKNLSRYVLAGQSAGIALDLSAFPPDTPLLLEPASDAPSPLPAVLLRVPRADTAVH